MLLFDVLAVRAGHLLFDFRNVGLTSSTMSMAGCPMDTLWNEGVLREGVFCSCCRH
jgi:hypothetical protein